MMNKKKKLQKYVLEYDNNDEKKNQIEIDRQKDIQMNR